jgi:hypothetical protein
MTAIDIGITIPFLVTGFFWVRGAWKQSVSDIVLSIVVLGAGVGCYGYLYSITTLSGVPWAVALLCAAVIVPLTFIRRRDRPAVRNAGILIAGALCLSSCLFVAEKKWVSTSNSLLVIAPYRQAGTWVFDDPRAGLKAEPFISGIPELIDKLVAEAGIADAEKGFRLLFSSQPFPGSQTKVVWRRSDTAGNWYYSERYNAEGWLCPSLFKYFKRAPKEIYVKAEKK